MDWGECVQKDLAEADWMEQIQAACNRSEHLFICIDSMFTASYAAIDAKRIFFNYIHVLAPRFHLLAL